MYTTENFLIIIQHLRFWKRQLLSAPLIVLKVLIRYFIVSIYLVPLLAGGFLPAETLLSVSLQQLLTWCSSKYLLNEWMSE